MTNAVEPPEVHLARLEERCKFILQELMEAKEARQAQYVTLIALEHRLGAVETTLREQAPAVQEFLTIKGRVIGAGMFGRGVWMAAVAAIGMIFHYREAIGAWLQRS